MHHLGVGGRVAADAPEVPPGHRLFSLRRFRRPEWVLRGLVVSRDALTVNRAVCAGERRSV